MVLACIVHYNGLLVGSFSVSPWQILSKHKLKLCSCCLQTSGNAEEDQGETLPCGAHRYKIQGQGYTVSIRMNESCCPGAVLCLQGRKVFWTLSIASVRGLVWPPLPLTATKNGTKALTKGISRPKNEHQVSL